MKFRTIVNKQKVGLGSGKQEDFSKLYKLKVLGGGRIEHNKGLGIHVYGYSVGYGNDQRASNNIGSELLFGLDYKLTGKNVEPLVRIDASWLNAHSEFTNLELDDLWTIHSKIQLRWGGAK